MPVREHQLTVLKSARFFTLGEPTQRVRQVTFVCHGYRQLASRFIRGFAHLEDTARLIVAPEGLSRFYIEDGGGEHGTDAKVGSSWMTREDRTSEINDYVTYLDVVYARVFKKVDRARVQTVALGFSQGATTASRWITQGRADIDRLLLWAGTLPPDIDLEAKRLVLSDAGLTIVAGEKDEFVDSKRIEEEKRRLEEGGIPYELIRFKGGHELDDDVLENLLEIDKGQR